MKTRSEAVMDGRPALPRRFTLKRRRDPLQILGSVGEASALLKALSHESRLGILCLLIEGEKTVCEIGETLSMRQPAVSQQLARLRADDLVEARRDGKQLYYSISRPEVAQVVDTLHAIFCPR